MIPPRGVIAANSADYISAGALALNIGGDLVDTAAIRSGNVDKITTAANDLVSAVQSAREQRVELVTPRRVEDRNLFSSAIALCLVPEREVDWYADQHDHYPRNRCRPTIDEKHSQNHNHAHQIKRRNERVAESAVGPIGIGPRFSQAKYPGDREI